MEWGPVIALPAPRLSGRGSLERSLRQRRSVRTFAPRQLALEEIGQLFWAMQGITDAAWGLRTAPSAGALYPLETFVALQAGVYHYEPVHHHMARTQAKDLRGTLQQDALDQEAVGQAPAVFIIAAAYERTASKYGRRAVRYVHLEAGHACQNLLLQATALGLAGVPIGAFYEDEVAKDLGFDKDLSPVYLVPIGQPKG